MKLICREIHLSFVDKMNERHIALVPVVVDESKIDDIFKDIKSPTLIRILSSCDTEFSNECDLRDSCMSTQLIWSFEVLPAPAAVQVPPTNVSPAGEIDIILPPVDLEVTSNCTCFNANQHGLSSFFDLGDLNQLDAISVVADIEVVSNPSSVDDVEEDELSDGELIDAAESVVLYSQYFAIKGAAWEDRYQEGLKLCSSKLLHQEEVKLRVKPEPGNIQDKNALTFEACIDDDWNILGYCALPKIPKLWKALQNEEITNLTIANLRRNWIHQVRDFRFSGGVNIVIRGIWQKDDPRNTYNSNLCLDG
ncbi:hypothetical protein OS493_006759 [Desmophyllum pertusum]|uniref:Uncharacterized protein n=1 Tax=Desmophyllum pertusum TaxID=174260 RepID=A0A9X0D4N6_9CNID|nr:hypothetical protein OS493_006759 [Desmophyllum pertusum]